jgi:hypothetical protein
VLIETTPINHYPNFPESIIPSFHYSNWGEAPKFNTGTMDQWVLGNRYDDLPVPLRAGLTREFVMKHFLKKTIPLETGSSTFQYSSIPLFHGPSSNSGLKNSFVFPAYGEIQIPRRHAAIPTLPSSRTNPYIYLSSPGGLRLVEPTPRRGGIEGGG